MFNRIVVMVLVAGWVALCGSVSTADNMDVRVDLRMSALPHPGGNWNSIPGLGDIVTVHSLIDYNTGLDSGITLQATDDFVQSGGYNVGNDAWTNPAFPWVDVIALRDYNLLTGDNTTGQITFAGLNPAGQYKVELLSVTSVGVPFLGQVTVQGAFDDDGDSESWNSHADGFLNADVMVWGSVSPDGAGKIVLDATFIQELFFVNALRISGVPVPGDANADYVVNEADAALLAANWQVSGAGVTWGMGDFNGDLVVNDIDATIMAANWTPTLLASVPEPSLLALLVTGGLALAAWRQYRGN